MGVLGRQALLVGVYLLLADGVQHGVHRLGNLVDLLDAGVLGHPDFRVPVLDGADVWVRLPTGSSRLRWRMIQHRGMDASSTRVMASRKIWMGLSCSKSFGPGWRIG